MRSAANSNPYPGAEVPGGPGLPTRRERHSSDSGRGAEPSVVPEFRSPGIPSVGTADCLLFETIPPPVIAQEGGGRDDNQEESGQGDERVVPESCYENDDPDNDSGDRQPSGPLTESPAGDVADGVRQIRIFLIELAFNLSQYLLFSVI